jgi:hypothetical protein
MQKGADGRQAHVAGADAVAALRLEVVEECEHEGGVQIPQAQGGDSALQPLLGKPEQQAEGVAVAGHGARAEALLLHQTLQEEALQQTGQIGFTGGHRHWRSSPVSAAACSKRCAAIAISSGMPVRYQ